MRLSNASPEQDSDIVTRDAETSIKPPKYITHYSSLSSWGRVLCDYKMAGFVDYFEKLCVWNECFEDRGIIWLQYKFLHYVFFET